jgi:DNA-binding protein H-NS
MQPRAQGSRCIDHNARESAYDSEWADRIRDRLFLSFDRPMPTYLELLARKRELDAQIEVARAAAASEALAEARAAIAEFGFTPEDLFGKAAKTAKKRTGQAASKSRAGERAGNDTDHGTLDLFA